MPGQKGLNYPSVDDGDNDGDGDPYYKSSRETIPKTLPKELRTQALTALNGLSILHILRVDIFCTFPNICIKSKYPSQQVSIHSIFNKVLGQSVRHGSDLGPLKI